MKNLVIDSNVPMIATGQIGEAWAVVILEEIAKGKVNGSTNVLFALELLDTYYQWKEHAKGKHIFNAFIELLDFKIEELTVNDFDLSLELNNRDPKISPRDCLHGANLINNNLKTIFSVDGTLFDQMENLSQPPLSTLLKSLGLSKEYISERHKS